MTKTDIWLHSSFLVHLFCLVTFSLRFRFTFPFTTTNRSKRLHLTIEQFSNERRKRLLMSSSLSEPSEKVVLILGSCGLDRLLGVSSYPLPDSKVRTTSYHEVGGGNAANTASAMALLSKAAFFKPFNIKIKLCTKVGDDLVGKQVIQELEGAGIDLSSPLFQVGKEGSTTGFTTILVSELEKTRTCIHTPGTCGELTPADVSLDDQTAMENLFHNVFHFHSDARHTDVALILAKEARKRGVPVSLDVEKDRQTKALDQLLEQCTVLITNSDQIDSYLSRLNKEYEERDEKEPLKDPKIIGSGNQLSESELQLFAFAIRPSSFFSRWYQQIGKEVVITKGDRGVLHLTCDSISQVDSGASENLIEIERDVCSGVVRVQHTFADHYVNRKGGKLMTSVYSIRSSGVLSDVSVVDTTGAGDAFAGGYILGALLSPEQLQCQSDPIVTALRLGCWVGGRKLEGPGSRTALPKAEQVDESIGTTYEQIQVLLQELLTDFR